jgi:hypothetical protein
MFDYYSNANDTTFSLYRKVDTDPESRRCNALRQSMSEVQSPSIIRVLFEWIGKTISETLTLTRKQYYPACRYLGHAADCKNWVRGFPKCSDCGVEITRASDLRRAIPTCYVRDYKLSGGHN